MASSPWWLHRVSLFNDDDDVEDEDASSPSDDEMTT